jgi:hypothetical protein
MASAPIFEVTRRDVVAVEHPMVVKNLENALKTFGVGGDTTGRPFRRVSNGHVLRPPHHEEMKAIFIAWDSIADFFEQYTDSMAAG